MKNIEDIIVAHVNHLVRENGKLHAMVETNNSVTDVYSKALKTSQDDFMSAKKQIDGMNEQIKQKERRIFDLECLLTLAEKRGNCYDILVDDIKNNKSLEPVSFKKTVFRLIKNSKPEE